MPFGFKLHWQLVWESGVRIVKKTNSNHFSIFAINKIDPAFFKGNITQIMQVRL